MYGHPAAKQSRKKDSLYDKILGRSYPGANVNNSTSAQQQNQSSAACIPIHLPQPETFIYNSAVERQFFDNVKESLTSSSRDGGAAWSEFLKCLDLYAQEVLSRSELLRFVEDLLGKRNTDLFEEFKRILAAAGSANAPTYDDAWYSVPLSEIDFSRCRRCSPSYRALPRDYPTPPCSGRNSSMSGGDRAAKVLNDVWVSLPVGSEESYTFRHMRKNQYEEVLFRCEDERFEIDMVIDTNAATLKRLEKINEEIAMLAQKELATPSHLCLNSSKGNSSLSRLDSSEELHDNSSSANKSISGIAGKKIQYTLDKRILGIIHMHAIARVYGDAGPEIIELLFKNPTMTVPVVVKRLRQKNREWRAARDILNQRWKELADINYHKSLDHRSLTWRTVDKRATSTRTMVAEIKDRAAHNGNEGENALALRRDKAKDEHGSFYDVTMGQTLSRKMDLKGLPKPTPTLFTPHLSLIYENNSWAQRDAYRIISYALERGAISPGDKERGHRMWRDFLRLWFDLSLSWMQKPATSYVPSVLYNDDRSQTSQEKESNSIGCENDETKSVGKNDEMKNDNASTNADDAAPMEEDGGDKFIELQNDARECMNGTDDEMADVSLLDQQPIPIGTHVSTVYGEGTVLGYRASDNIFIVSFPYGAKGYLRSNTLLCTMFPTEKSPMSAQLRKSDSETLNEGDFLVFGTQSMYLFFRLHHVLVKRLNIARKLADEVTKKRDVNNLVEEVTVESGDTRTAGQKRYDIYLSLLYPLVEVGYSNNAANAAVEGGKYEDRVRSLLGHGAYELATMDKLISHILKNLQNMGNDEMLQDLIEVSFHLKICSLVIHLLSANL